MIVGFRAIAPSCKRLAPLVINFLGEVAYGEVNSGTNLGGRRESSAASGILSTWGLTNALMSPVTSQSDDKYVCPNDRQLSLRAK